MTLDETMHYQSVSKTVFLTSANLIRQPRLKLRYHEIQTLAPLFLNLTSSHTLPQTNVIGLVYC